MALNTSIEARRSTRDVRMARERSGGPRRPRGGQSRYEVLDVSGRSITSGSHMPLDADPHWRWNNPLNILPAAIVVLLLLALVSLIIL
jgi:hypothetical protein